ncbi:MAG: DUF4339 domain-containing protein [Armatimonadetes bacterium]|nr:DUF4339 domain-containing protein [Armatimonadota bacterium]
MAGDLPEGNRPAAEDAASEPRWHVAIGGEVYGPTTRSELMQWAADGRLPPGTQVTPLGGEQWIPIHRAPGLEDIPATPPPRPGSPTYAYAAPVGAVPARPLCDCLHCGGPVTNIAPAYGFPWGFFQRSLRPRFRCGQCGRALAYEELSCEAQTQISRGVRTGTFAWFAIVIGLILFIALCVIVPVMSVR